MFPSFQIVITTSLIAAITGKLFSLMPTITCTFFVGSRSICYQLWIWLRIAWCQHIIIWWCGWRIWEARLPKFLKLRKSHLPCKNYLFPTLKPSTSASSAWGHYSRGISSQVNHEFQALAALMPIYSCQPCQRWTGRWASGLVVFQLPRMDW